VAWIESHQEIAYHPKTRKLARRLGVGIPQAVGHLHLLWHWALSYAEDGDLSRHSDEDIAIGVMWEGDEAEFVAALVDAGWIDDDLRSLHDWGDYAGRLIERRKRNAERMKSARAAHAPRTHRAHDDDDARTTQATQPNPTNQTEPTSSLPAPQVNGSSGESKTDDTPAVDARVATASSEAAVPAASADQSKSKDEVQRLEALRSDFEKFWEQYPNQPNGKKPEKPKAWAAWRRLSRDDRHAAETAVVHYRADCDAGTFAKHAFRWLRDRTFMDWLTPASSVGAQPATPVDLCTHGVPARSCVPCRRESEAS
jgi:hypothetical protein